MNEQDFMCDLWDLMLGYTNITQEKFTQKYKELFFGVCPKRKFIELMDDHSVWRLSIQKIRTDEPNFKED